MIQRYASALVHDGVPIEDLATLRSLVEPEMAKRGRTWLMKRAGKKTGGGIGNIAIAIKMAAKHWVQVDPEAF